MKNLHLMPTDKGVMIYRRRIRKLSKDLEEGKDPPQPQKVKGQVVRTNGQDTILKAPTVLMGFGLQDENAHSPDEHFSLDNFRIGMYASSLFYNYFAE